MDEWTEEQLLKMELGGNKKFKTFLNSHGIDKPNYKSEELIAYRRELEETVRNKLPLENQTSPIEPKKDIQ